MNPTADRRLLCIPAVLFAFLPAMLIATGSSTSRAAILPQAAASGEKMTVEGLIARRDADTFILRDASGRDIEVALTDETEVKEKKINPFRRGRNYAVTQLLRGLRVEVSGRRNPQGQLVAEEVKLKDEDLRFASSVETRVDPIETRLTDVETKLVQAEQNAQRLSGQVDEVSAVAAAARSAAKAAQETGDAAKQAALDAAREGVEAAKSTAREANERISALDDYEVKDSTTVLFGLESTALSQESIAQLEALAGSAKNEKGYMIEVTGFASSDGDESYNVRLSQQRADAVVRYLTENHDIPLRRIVTPFGFGSKQPVADNSTLEGRRKNRRVEVKVLVSKGLASQIIK
jgi:outer membrane protein OmpA-like peptidoglycan-associated protein